MPAFTELRNAMPKGYIPSLRRQILACRYLATNNLNRDFVGTRGFSVVFRASARARVEREFPFFKTYLDVALLAECNAFYLNPLLLALGSHVAPHIDRSLRSYVAEIDPPLSVSVLYVEVPSAMEGGALVLRRGKKHMGRIVPAENTLIRFDGDLTHSVDRMETKGARMSLVCEQYRLTDDELSQVPEFVVESRATGNARRYEGTDPES